MKRLKSTVSLALCALLAFTLFAACGNQEGEGKGNVTYGRYVEQDVTPEGMKGYPNSFMAFSDGTLDLIAAQYPEEDSKELMSYRRWRSENGGENWEEVDFTWTQEYIHDYSEYYDNDKIPPEEIGLGSMVPCENGDILYQVYTSTYDEAKEEHSYKVELFRITQQGEKSPFSLPDYDQVVAEGRNANLNQMQPLPGGRMYVSYYVEPTQEEMNDQNFNYNSSEKKAVYDTSSGEKLYDLEFEGWDIYYNDTTLYVTDYEKGVLAFNLTDGKTANVPMPSKETLQKLTQGNMWQGSTFVDPDGNFYSVSARGMTKYPVSRGGAAGSEAQSQPASASGSDSGANAAAQSTEDEQVMEGLNYTYGSPLYGINSLVYSPKDGSITMSLYNSGMDSAGEGRLLRYVWDDKAIASSDEKIKVYSLYDNYSVRLGLSEFKRQNPDVTIEFETAYDYTKNEQPGEEVAYDEETGEPIPSDNTAEKSLEDVLRALNTELLNGTGPDVLVLDGLPVESFIEKGVLADLSEQAKAAADVYPSLLEPLYRDGKIYAIPANFYMPVLLGDKGYIEQFGSIEALVKGIQDGAAAPTYKELGMDATMEEQDAYYQEMNKPKTEEDQPALLFSNLEELFEAFYSTSAPAIFSEKGGIDKDALTAFLQDVKTVSDKYGLADPDNPYYMPMGGMSMSFGGYAQFDFPQSLSSYCNRQSRMGFSRLGSLHTVSQVADSLYWGAIRDTGKEEAAVFSAAGDGPDTVDPDEIPMEDGGETPAESVPEEATDVTADAAADEGTDEPDAAQDAGEDASDAGEEAMDDAPEEGGEADAAAQPAAQGEGDDAERLPDRDPQIQAAPGLSAQVYVPAQMVGVTTTTKQPELARAFVSAMLSEEVQKHDMSNGFPVTKAAYAKQEENIIKRNQSYMEKQGIKPVPFDFDALVGQLQTPYYENDYLKGVIRKPIESFCTGEKTLEATAEQIVKETELYFAERQ